MRTKVGLSQAELAKAAGVTQAHVSAIERGLVIEPSWAKLRLLERALGVADGALTKGLAA